MKQLGIVDERSPLTPRDAGVPAWDDTPHKEWMARRMEVYAAQVDVMDQGIGRIVEAVRRSGRADDTLILFLADNGGCAEEIAPRWGGLHIPDKTRNGRPVRRGNVPDVMPGPEDTYQSYGLPWANASNTPFRLYKHWVHEGGISTPLIAYWPAKVKHAGGLTSEPGHLIDIMATCVDAAGAEYPAEHAGKEIIPLEGKSLLPVLETGRREGHEAIYWEHEGNRAVRMGQWKLVSKFPGDWELYDLQQDRTETHDVASEHPDKVQKMSAKYRAWALRSQVVPWKQIQKRRQQR